VFTGARGVGRGGGGGGGVRKLNPLNAELNPICHLLALLGARHILHVSRVWVKVTGYKLRKQFGAKL